MKANILFCVGLLLTILSCDDSEEERAVINNEAALLASLPPMPTGAKFDVTDDGVDDIELIYGLFIWDGYRSTGYGMYGTFRPLGTNLILEKRDEKLLPIPLFNQFNDTVTKDVTNPLGWAVYGVEVVTITSSPFVWPDEWKISSSTIQDAYYIALKIKDDDGYKVGWVKIKIDKTNGKVSIVDKELTDENSIIINR
jgi:hypothetical protein